MSNDDISSNPSYKKLRDHMDAAIVVRNFLNSLPKSEWAQTLVKILDRVPELKSALDNSSLILDEFNKYFSSRGWIAHETMNSAITDSAVKFAKCGRISDGEKVLIDYYSYDNLKERIRLLEMVPEFKSRMRLIELGLEDYHQNRFHACVPILLMMADGIVNDVTKTVGLFAENVDLWAWDSIAGHQSGLTQIAKLFSRGRTKTNAELIEIPFRNGILHGRELGYDNAIVAAKAWALLFGVRDWVVARKKPQPIREDEDNRSLEELIDELRNRKREQALIKQWEPRSISIGVNIPARGALDVYAANTPEHATVALLSYWGDCNYGRMAEMLERSRKDGLADKKLAGNLRRLFEGRKLVDYELVQVKDHAPSITEVNTSITLASDGNSEVRDLTFRWIYMDENRLNLSRQFPNGKWFLIDHFLWSL